MGSRMIRDGLLDSDRYWSVSTDARQMFVHLLLLADDFGCVSLSATFVRRRCFNDMPSHERIARLINELSDMDLIRPYEVDRACYGFIPRFKQKLQRVTLKHPAPPEHLLEGDADAIDKFSKQRAAIAGEIVLPFGKEWDALRFEAFERDGHACIRCKATEDLHGHHLIPKSKGGETTLENIATLCGSCNSWARNNDEKCQQIREIAQKAASDRMLARIGKVSGQTPEVEVKRREEKKTNIDRSSIDSLAGFDEFWKQYPKKANKVAAQKAWKKQKVGSDLLTQIITAVEKAKNCEQWRKDNGQYIPFASTWLNNRRWEDEIGPSARPQFVAV